jgi:hypothetical protein
MSDVPERGRPDTTMMAAASVTEPGYPGRTRGRVVFRRHPDAWVAVVPTPGRGPKPGKLIIALGASAAEATAAAEKQWHQVWLQRGPDH